MSAEGASRCRAERRRLSCALTVLTLAAITSSSLSALSLYRALALQAEVEVLRTEVNRRREAQGGVAGGGVGEPQRAAEEDREDAEVRCACGSEAARPRRARYVCNARALPFRRRRSAARPLERLLSGFFRGPSRPQTPWWARSAAPPEDRSEPSLKKRSLGREPAQTVFQPCLQMMADSRRKPYQKEFALDVHVAVPWQTGLKRGTALEGDQDDILVREEGYYFIYSQVFYKDPKYAMGHIVLRTKQNVVGDESQHVVLFRCVQSMNAKVPYNTCFTGGIVKLESGDRVELLIPRSTANISLDGDSTFLGAVKLA
ncbi:tumor necrosis factor ligand superfamily member 13B isoform X2 [Electrophorus electricus]|uniref:tumor necrosis factor ligand superfamily member 13B isoform X2 n=1 Tax=Electrophorus electricus TaxID=8005 RepID=UPI0015CF9D0C|nr:tumor necrosis factor ligand superfamily member 13B isoform X2 [Electrophorus electricus]